MLDRSRPIVTLKVVVLTPDLMWIVIAPSDRILTILLRIPVTHLTPSDESIEYSVVNKNVAVVYIV